MGRGSIGPGDDVEAWCTRCRMNLYHRVIAVVGNEIKRVQCLTCGGDHQYHSPKGVAHDRVLEKRPKVVQSRPEPKPSGRAKSEWSRIMKEMPAETVPRPYAVSDEYQPTEYIAHPVFGPGRVLAILGRQRIEVIFKDGRKVLICNTISRSNK